jgi:hypothetical protein
MIIDSYVLAFLFEEILFRSDERDLALSSLCLSNSYSNFDPIQITEDSGLSTDTLLDKISIWLFFY